jgi:hypothetical protein
MPIFSDKRAEAPKVTAMSDSEMRLRLDSNKDLAIEFAINLAERHLERTDAPRDLREDLGKVVQAVRASWEDPASESKPKKVEIALAISHNKFMVPLPLKGSQLELMVLVDSAASALSISKSGSKYDVGLVATRARQTAIRSVMYLVPLEDREKIVAAEKALQAGEIARLVEKYSPAKAPAPGVESVAKRD